MTKKRSKSETKDATIQVRVRPEVKKKLQKTLEGLGLDISSATSMFYNQVIHTRSIPFQIRTINGFTLQQEQEYIDAQRDEKNGRPYRTVDEMMDDI